jgi:hypothetical protein
LDRVGVISGPKLRRRPVEEFTTRDRFDGAAFAVS